MDLANCFIFETNGFMANAGMLGFIRLLEQVKAKKGVDYDFNDYQLLIDKDYLVSLDLAQAYIETANELFYENTHYAKIKKALGSVGAYEELLEREDSWTKEEKVKVKEGLAEIVKQLDVIVATKSLSNACGWLLNEGVLSENIPNLIQEAKKTKDFSEKVALLLKIEQCLSIPKVKEILCLVGVSLRVLSHFWVNKAFIKKSQGNIVILSDKNMRDLLDEGVIQSFKAQLKETSLSDKVCSECGVRIPKKSKPSTLTFMNDIADDVAKKPSAFWNFDKDQALLCDGCTFLYLLMPLGFTSMGQELVFVNANTNIESLKTANELRPSLKTDQTLNWNSLCQQLIERCIQKQTFQIDNIQVIIRTTEKNKQRYHFEILSYDALKLIEKNEGVLRGLSKCYAMKLPTGDYWKVSEDVILKILNQLHLYPTIHQLLRLGLLSDYEKSVQIQLPLVYHIQLTKRQIQLEGGNLVKSKQLYFATKNAMEDGKALHHHLTVVTDKGISSIMYRLLNALQTNNKYEFLNTVLRLHTSCEIKLSSDFMKFLNEPAFFKDMGYAYLLGLKGIGDVKESSTKAEEEK